jgi:hypothetical protein
MFTQQQANAMRYVVENFRQDLLLSNDDLTFNMSSIVAFPNPAKDILNLVISKEMKSFSMHALITSVDGRIVKVLSPQNQTIDVSDLEAGIYFLNFPQSGSAFSVRFVKM